MIPTDVVAVYIPGPAPVVTPALASLMYFPTASSASPGSVTWEVTHVALRPTLLLAMSGCWAPIRSKDFEPILQKSFHRNDPLCDKILPTGGFSVCYVVGEVRTVHVRC